jgi:guanylate kinase
MYISDIKGHLILVMAPTGSGKGTLLKHVRAVFPELTYTVSCTTRAMRPGEVEGVDYYFISYAEFERKISNGDFVEWAEYGGNLYGTLKSELESRLTRGENTITEIEMQGVSQLESIIPKAFRTIIYIDAGDWEVIKARVITRAPMSDEELSLRHARYIKECTYKSFADKVVHNGDGMLESAKKEMEQIIAGIITKYSHS